MAVLLYLRSPQPEITGNVKLDVGSALFTVVYQWWYIAGSTHQTTRSHMAHAVLTIDIPDDDVERIVWVYSRNTPDINTNHGKLFLVSDEIRLPAPSNGAPAHYGIIVLRVEKESLLREDGHAVIAVGRKGGHVVPDGVTCDVVIDAFKGSAAALTQSALLRVPTKCMTNPPSGETWSRSHIRSTGTVVVVTCDPKSGIVAWDTHSVYQSLALGIVKRAIAANNAKHKVDSNHEFDAHVPGGSNGNPLSLCGFARVSEMQLSWHSMPTPGTFGLIEGRPIDIDASLWTRCVDIAELMCGFKESEFLSILKSLAPFNTGDEDDDDNDIGPHIVKILVELANDPSNRVEYLKSATLLNCLEALFGIAVTVLSWTAQWKDEKFDNITSMVGKLGTEQDCEDQATNTIAIVNGIKASKTLHVVNKERKRDLRAGDGRKKPSFMAETLAALIQESVQSSHVVLGFVEQHIAVPPHGARGKPTPTTIWAGHGWAEIGFYDTYRPNRPQRRFFLESTCPYLMHPGPSHPDPSMNKHDAYIDTFNDLYADTLTMYAHPDLLAMATYKTPQLQPSKRYKVVAFMCSAEKSYYVGPRSNTGGGDDAGSRAPFRVGVDTRTFTRNEATFLDASSLNATDTHIYKDTFAPFFFHPEPDPDRNVSLHRVLSSRGAVAASGQFLTRHGGYKFDPPKKYIEELVVHGVRIGRPENSVVIVSAFDWNTPQHRDNILKTLMYFKQSADEYPVHIVISLPLCDLIIIGMTSFRPALTSSALPIPIRTMPAPIVVRSSMSRTTVNGALLRESPELTREDLIEYLTNPSTADDPEMSERFRHCWDLILIREAAISGKPAMARAAFKCLYLIPPQKHTRE